MTHNNKVYDLQRGIKGGDRKHIKIKDYYDNEDFNSNDVYEIAENTTKEDKLFNCKNIPNHLKSNSKYYENGEQYKFEIDL